MPDFERIQVLLHSDGRLHWEPGGIFKTTCDIDIAFFPFDTQHCPLLIGAYSYYRWQHISTHRYSLCSSECPHSVLQLQAHHVTKTRERSMMTSAVIAGCYVRN